MIDRSHHLPLARQARELGISRGSLYYQPRSVSTDDLALMRRMDELHLDFPFAGSRMLRDLLVGEGFKAGRLHVAMLMKRMGIEAIYRKPDTSKPAPGHRIYPYLLRKLPVTRPNHVWAMDITYAPMARGFVYLAAQAASAPVTTSPACCAGMTSPSVWTAGARGATTSLSSASGAASSTRKSI